MRNSSRYAASFASPSGSSCTRPLKRKARCNALSTWCAGIRNVIVALTFVTSAAAQSYRFTSVAAPTAAIGGVVIDAAGNTFLSDYEASIIWKITPAGEVSTFAGRAGVRDAVNGSGETARFSLPRGLVFDSHGNLYVADSGNDLVRRITPAGDVTTFAGLPGSGSTNGDRANARFDTPWALAADGADNIYVADRDNRMIRRITPDGIVSTLAGRYIPSYEPRLAADGGRDVALLYDPVGLAVDRTGNVYVADFPFTLRKITPQGVVSTVAGSPNSRGSSDGTGVAARFNGITGIMIAANGDAIVTDTNNTTVRSVSPAGVVRTLAGQVEQAGTDEGVGGAARFTGPQIVTSDGNSNLLISEQNRAVLRRAVPYVGDLGPILHTPPRGSAGLLHYAGANTGISFIAGATGTEPLAYQWFKNSTPLAGATSNTLNFPAASASEEGSYTVRVSNGAGAVVSNAVAVSVFTPKLTSFTSRRSVAGGSFLWGIAASGSQLVAVGTGGTILTSGDGRTWVRRNSTTTEWLVGVVFGDGKFVAVGDHGTILVSVDGATWRRAVASNTTQRLNNVTFGAQRFVAVGEGGTIVTSSDGDTWTPRASGVTTWLRGVIYEPFRPLPLFAPPRTGPNIFSFTSGDTGGSRFYVCGENGVVLSSSTGETWTGGTLLPSTTSGKTPDLETLALGPAAIGEDGAIAYGIVIAYTQTLAGKMPSFPGGLTSLTYSSVAFMSWQKTNVGLDARFRGVARGAGATFIMGENGTIAAASSFAGPWALIPSGTSGNLVSAVFRGDTLFVVGENETILESETLHASRLANLSARGRVTADARPMISGFVITGTSAKTILLRAAGPALAGFGLGETLAAPTLTLFDGAGRSIASNTGWSSGGDGAAISAAATRVGAFPFASGSADSALLVRLEPGGYTARVNGELGTAGISIMEIYDAESTSTDSPRTINLSTRGHAGTGGDRLISGFVVAGADSRQVLLRAIGPSLTAFGVPDVLAEPKIELFDARGKLIMESRGAWSQERREEIRTAAARAGAFALEETSKDAAMLVNLAAGSYTVQISGLGDTAGTALIEVYDVP